MTSQTRRAPAPAEGAAAPGTAVAPRDPARELTPAERKLVNIHNRLARDTFQQQLRRALPKYATPERMVATAVLAINRNPVLLDCTPESLAESVLTIATWGLEIGRTAHIVPYGARAQALVDWKGMVELAIRGKSITSARADIVFANDEFYVEKGLNQRLVHRPAWQSDAGEPIGAYAIVRFPSGDQQFTLMSRAEIERHRDRYAQSWRRPVGKRGPWESEPLEQWKKTVMRRLLKYVPQNPLLAQVVAAEDEDDAQLQQAADAMLGALGPRPRANVRAGGYDLVGDGDPVVNTFHDAVAAHEAAASGGVAVPVPAGGPQPEVVDMAAKPRVRVERKAGECPHGVKDGTPCVECGADEAEARQRELDASAS